MKVLHINQSDIGGGAAIAGYRLHSGLLHQGIDSKLLVAGALTDDKNVDEVPRRRYLEAALYQVLQPLGLSHLHRVSSFDILRHPFFQKADVLNFHNLNTGYFNYLAIPRLTAYKPAVFTLHDMWGFTGHCAYSYDCNRWQMGCGHCPYPDTYPAIRRDATRWEWKLKDWIYSSSNLEIVAPSTWLAELAQASMLGRFPVHHIPNGIDTNVYQPLETDLCRSALGISSTAKVLLFSAASLNDLRKGGNLLLQALQQLPSSLKEGCLLLTFGGQPTQLETETGIATMHLGYISSDRLKSIAYSAADLFIFPTRADNLPLVLQESMACGTPMVSFKVGGVPDLVRPNVTGYLAQLGDISDFRKGITEILEDDEKRQLMGLNCRQIAQEEYSLELQATRYKSLYEKALAKNI
jgi:glycosyltransferase involved in cell wall biosynthesis